MTRRKAPRTSSSDAVWEMPSASYSDDFIDGARNGRLPMFAAAPFRRLVPKA
jgi:hypothetical protein